MQDQGQIWPGLLVIADDPNQEVDICDSAWQQDSTCSWWAVLSGLFVVFAVVCWLQRHSCILNHFGFCFLGCDRAQQSLQITNFNTLCVWSVDESTQHGWQKPPAQTF